MMLLRYLLRTVLLASALSAMAVVASPVGHAATFVIINNDGPNEGFNDPTAAAPVGGNTGTTIGAQRLIAFQNAANIWGGLLTSNVTIRVSAQFDPLSCTANSAVLGSAGPLNAFRDFSGAPVASTFYPVALANALHGSDLDAGDDIDATFSSTIGTPGCLTGSGWYYGLDSNPPGNLIDFVSVLLHELGHGLGFLTFVNLSTGAKLSGLNDTFMRNLENHGASPSDYPSMTNAQRVTASTATGNLHWVGANVRAASGVLTAGTVGDHVRMFAPNPQQSGSSVSHWDTVLTPNQVMEPSYTGAIHTPVLELPLFQDIGWTLSTPSSSLSVTPATQIASSGNQGGPFSPSSFQYQLSATSGSVNYSITGTPNWLTPSATSGTVTTSATTITFSVNANANGFAPGTFGPTTINFTNTTNGQGNTSRTATLTVNSAGPPANDNFASATTISGQSGSTTGTNANATLQSGEPAPFAGTGTHTVWWKWTAAVSGEVTFNTAGSNFDTVLTAYTGSAVNALTLAAGNDDFNSTTQSSITFEVQAGFTYYLRVDGFSPSDTGNITLGWSEPLAASPLVAAVLPYARSVQFGQAATAFGVMINSGGTTATSCRPNVPAGFTDPFVYQTTNTSNQLTGSPNTPVNIAPGATQNFVFGYTPGSVLNAVEIGMVFDCTNTVPALSLTGVNTFILSAASTPTPDIIAIGVTSSGDGIVSIPGNTGTGFFAAAGINIGSTATITASADDGGRGLPVTLTICQTDSGGNCMAPPASSTTMTFANNASLTFTIFAHGTGNVPFDPAHNRLFLRFKDGGSVTRGATNVAVRTGP